MEETTKTKTDHLPANYCNDCRLVHPPMVTCSDARAKVIADILFRAGAEDYCRGCRAKIYWIKHLNGKNAPYTEAGLIHFVDCPERDQFKRT